MVLLYLTFAAGGVAALVFRKRLVDPESPEGLFIFIGLTFLVMGAGLAAVYIAAMLLPPMPWLWTYNLVLICLGMGSACYLPICIPLLIFWLKPENKAYFGRT